MDRIKELEKKLEFITGVDENFAERKNALELAYWKINNSGYSDAMASRLASGIYDNESDLWSKIQACKFEINELLKLYNNSEQI